jgi:hypothetical protein
MVLPWASHDSTVERPRPYYHSIAMSVRVHKVTPYPQVCHVGPVRDRRVPCPRGRIRPAPCLRQARAQSLCSSSTFKTQLRLAAYVPVVAANERATVQGQLHCSDALSVSGYHIAG